METLVMVAGQLAGISTDPILTGPALVIGALAPTKPKALVGALGFSLLYFLAYAAMTGRQPLDVWAMQTTAILFWCAVAYGLSYFTGSRRPVASQ
jgi:hypothetical protein